MAEKSEVQNENPIVGAHAMSRSTHVTEVLCQWEGETVDATPYTLAELTNEYGLRIVFSYDEAADDYGVAVLAQANALGRIGKPIFSDFGTPLEAYLAIAPDEVPVPEELLAFKARCTDRSILPRLEHRGIASSCVVVSEIESVARSVNQERDAPNCNSTYYPWWHWHDSAEPGLAPASYYSSTFGGKCWKASSYIFNCVPPDSPSWGWARHQMYYKNAWGNYKRQYQEKVPPGAVGEHTVWGLSKRYRRVTYDDGWGSSPNSQLKYTREGRFPGL